MLRSIVQAATTVTALGFLGHTSHRLSSSPPYSSSFVTACAGKPAAAAAAPDSQPPFVAHSTLYADALRALHGCDVGRGGRVIVVGDVHGCCDELRDLLAEVNWQQGR